MALPSMPQNQNHLKNFTFHNTSDYNELTHLPKKPITNESPQVASSKVTALERDFLLTKVGKFHNGHEVLSIESI